MTRLRPAWRYRRHIVLSCVCVGLLALALLAFRSLTAASPSSARSGCTDATAATVVTQTNGYRSSLGLPRLRSVAKLHSFALTHARDMATSGTLTHSSSGGLSFAERARASTYRYRTMRENIQVARASAAMPLATALVRNWKQSPPHDANLRARDISQIGVAVASRGRRCYASMDLGQPLTSGSPYSVP